MFTDKEAHHIRHVKLDLFNKVQLKMADIPTTVLRDFLYDRCVLTGGAIASIFHIEEPNDYDLYLRDEQDILFFKQYISSMNERELSFIKTCDEKYIDTTVNGKMVTANATTFVNGLQVITLHSSEKRCTFDFVHCMPWYNIKLNLLNISEKQYHAIVHKQLIKNENKNSFALTDKRIEKYLKRGWRFPK